MSGKARSPAFPRTTPVPSRNSYNIQRGMSMLDYFAGQALVGLVDSEGDFSRSARMAWGYARAMVENAPRHGEEMEEEE